MPSRAGRRPKPRVRGDVQGVTATPEDLARVAAHEQGVRDLMELRRLQALRAFEATPKGRLVLALERIADALTRAFPERT
jgi:hypothetical protein